MISESITESFRKLSADDKIRLLEELWSEVAQEYAAMPLSEPHPNSSMSGSNNMLTIQMTSSHGTRYETMPVSESPESDLEQAWSEELARRVAELDGGTVETIPWAEVREELILTRTRSVNNVRDC